MNLGDGESQTVVFSPGFPHFLFDREYSVGARISSGEFTCALFTRGYRGGRGDFVQVTRGWHCNHPYFAMYAAI